MYAWEVSFTVLSYNNNKLPTKPKQQPVPKLQRVADALLQKCSFPPNFISNHKTYHWRKFFSDILATALLWPEWMCPSAEFVCVRVCVCVCACAAQRSPFVAGRSVWYSPTPAAALSGGQEMWPPTCCCCSFFLSNVKTHERINMLRNSKLSWLQRSIFICAAARIGWWHFLVRAPFEVRAGCGEQCRALRLAPAAVGRGVAAPQCPPAPLPQLVGWQRTGPRCSSQPWWRWTSCRAAIQPLCGTMLVRFFVRLGNRDPSCCLSLACQLLVLHRCSVNAALWKRLYLQAAAQLCCLKGLTDPNCYDTCN